MYFITTLRLSGFSQLRLHKRVELLLQSRDVDGVGLCHGGLQIQYSLKYKESSSKCLPVEARENGKCTRISINFCFVSQIADNRDGTYGIGFTPDAEGALVLIITINDKPIKVTMSYIAFVYFQKYIKVNLSSSNCERSFRTVAQLSKLIKWFF